MLNGGVIRFLVLFFLTTNTPPSPISHSLSGFLCGALAQVVKAKHPFRLSRPRGYTAFFWECGFIFSTTALKTNCYYWTRILPARLPTPTAPAPGPLGCQYIHQIKKVLAPHLPLHFHFHEVVGHIPHCTSTKTSGYFHLPEPTNSNPLPPRSM